MDSDNPYAQFAGAPQSGGTDANPYAQFVSQPNPAAQPQPQAGGFWKNLGAGLEQIPSEAMQTVEYLDPALMLVPQHIRQSMGNSVTHGIGQMTGLDPDKVPQNTFSDKLARNMGASLPFLAVPGVGEDVTAANLARAGATGLGSVLGQTTAQQAFPNSPTAQTIGALVGGLGTGALASGRAIPRPTEDASTLLQNNVPLTPGQMFGPTAKSIEDRLTSIPILGDVIKGGQRRGVEGFNTSILNRALAPLGQMLPRGIAAGRAAVGHVYDQINSAYNRILPNLTGQSDPQMISDFQDVKNNLIGEGAKQDTIDRLNNVINAQVHDRAQNGMFTGDSLKTAQSELGRLASEHMSSDSADDRILGRGILDTQNAFNAMLERHNPDYAEDLENVNNAFSQYARIRKAASSLGSKDGVFSPAQYANAVKSADTSAGHGAYARGAAFQQDISDPANRALPQQVPDSGTTGRWLTAALLGGGAHFSPAAAIPAAGMASIYTRPGMAALAKYGNLANKIPVTKFPFQGLVPAATPALNQQQSPYSRGGFV